MSSAHLSLKFAFLPSKLNTVQLLSTAYVESKDTQEFLEVSQGVSSTGGCPADLQTERESSTTNPAPQKRKLRPKQAIETLSLRHLFTHSEGCPSARLPRACKELQNTNQQRPRQPFPLAISRWSLCISTSGGSGILSAEPGPLSVSHISVKAFGNSFKEVSIVFISVD